MVAFLILGLPADLWPSQATRCSEGAVIAGREGLSSVHFAILEPITAVDFSQLDFLHCIAVRKALRLGGALLSTSFEMNAATSN